jgi:hypothetical protein
VGAALRPPPLPSPPAHPPRSLTTAPRALAPAPSAAEIKQRQDHVRARQAEYDRYNALPRKLPSRAWNEGEFAARLDSVMGDNELKRGALMKVKLKEAMTEQTAARRHEQWEKQVYLPIATAVAGAVDANFAAIRKTRLDAMEGYLRATDAEGVGGGFVFLDGNTGGASARAGRASSYNPWAVNGATVRAHVTVRDPLKVVLEKRSQESALLAGAMPPVTPLRRSGGGGGGGGGGPAKGWLDGAPDRLPAHNWTLGFIETQPFGHFEVAEAKSGGAFQMAFARRDTASTWRGYDFDGAGAYTQRQGVHGGTRLAEVDAEFPIGKKFGYPQRMGADQTARTVRHHVPRGVYDYALGGADGLFTDEKLLDPVRPALMATVAPSVPSAGYGATHMPRLGAGKTMGAEPYPREVGVQLGASYRAPVAPPPAGSTGGAATQRLHATLAGTLSAGGAVGGPVVALPSFSKRSTYVAGTTTPML